MTTDAPAEPSPAVPRQSPESGFSDPTRAVAFIMMTVSLVMVLFHLQDASIKNANTGSRYATIEALVDHGTFFIDESRYVRTPDKMKVGDHWISSKPPLLPTYGAAIYWVYQKLTGGNTIVEYEGHVVWLVSFFTGWLSHLCFLVFFYKLIRLLLKRQLAILLGVAAASFSWLGVAWGTAINNHGPGASLGMAGFYLAYRIVNGTGVRWWHWVSAGFVLGVLPAIDLPMAAVSTTIGLYLLVHDWKKTLLLFAPAALPGILFQFITTYQITGSVIPAYMNAELKDYPGNYFRKVKTGIDALREPKWLYAFHVLLGHHGVFSMTPLFVFSLVEIIRRLRRRGPFFRETLVIVGGILPIFLFYILKTRNYGGWCVGMRWLVPSMGFLLLYFALWLENARLGKVKAVALTLAFAVSSYHVQDGLTSPFQFSQWHNLIDEAPNRGRLGPKWNLPKPKRNTSKKKSTRR